MVFHSDHAGHFICHIIEQRSIEGLETWVMINSHPNAFLLQLFGRKMGSFDHKTGGYQTNINAFIIGSNALTNLELITLKKLIILYFTAYNPEIERSGVFNAARKA